VQLGLTRNVGIVLPKLHPQQREFVNDPHRIVVAACGTKTGKTFGLSVWMIREAWNSYQSLNWWCAPTLRQARTAYNLIGRLLPPEKTGLWKTNRNEMTFTFLRRDGTEHSVIEMRSADNPNSLRGEGVKAAVVDEAAIWSLDSFTSVWTTLTRTKGKLRIISTPKGRNWFYYEWLKGSPNNPKHTDYAEYASYQLPTSSSPYVDPAMIEAARLNLPADTFRQEYLAMFLDESAGVFRNITACQTATLYDRPMVGRRYVIGIDWAKHHDYTVMIVGDMDTHAVCKIERYNDIDWNSNIDRALRLAREWNMAHVMMDSTGIGDVPFDLMAGAYPFTNGYNIATNFDKVALIQKLQFALERKEIHTPLPREQNTSEQRALAAVLEEELRTYSYTMSGTGKYIFSAPEGMFDDTVIALALVNWMFSEIPQHYKARQVQGV
jgi:hypothetical protein